MRPQSYRRTRDRTCRLAARLGATLACAGGAIAVATVQPGGLTAAVTTPSRGIAVSAQSPNKCLPRTPSRAWCGDGRRATRAKLAWPLDVASIGDGGLIIADARNNVVRRVDRHGIITTLAGDGRWLAPEPSVPAPRAHFRLPIGVALESDGSVLVADASNDAIRRIQPDGLVTIVASPSGPIVADLRGPNDVISTPAGTLVADTSHHRVLRITREGEVQTVAGTGEQGHSGDGGPATAARLIGPRQLAMQPDGGLLIADLDSLRRVAPDGTISTLVSPPHARIIGVAADADGRVFFTDAPRIMRRDASGRVRRVAGAPRAGYNGDRGPATKIRLTPAQLAIDRDRSVLIADTFNDRIRRLRGGRITTVAGSGRPYIFGRGRGASGPTAHAAASCEGYLPRFSTFGFQPLDGRRLRLRARARVVLKIATSRVARVRLRLQRRGGALLVKRMVRFNAGIQRRIRVHRRLRAGRYRARIDGKAIGEDARRCDIRAVAVR